MEDTNPSELMEALKIYRKLYGNTTINSKKIDKIIKDLKEKANGNKK